MANETLKELKYDGKKIVAEVARRDAKGNVIDKTYIKSTDNIDADTLAGKTYQEILNLINKKQDSSNFLSLIQNLSTLYTGYLHVELSNVGTDTRPSYTAVAKVDPLPVATSKLYGIVKLGSDDAQQVDANTVSSTASRTYAIQKDSSGKLVVNVPWTSSGYTLPDATAYTVGGVKMKVQYISDTSDVYEVGIDIVSDAHSTRPLYIRAGRFKQTSGSASSTSNFTFKKSMDTINDRSADRVVVILGDSKGQSTNGGYMGSLAVDSSNYSGFSYRASNTEKGYVMYIALGSW